MLTTVLLILLLLLSVSVLPAQFSGAIGSTKGDPAKGESFRIVEKDFYSLDGIPNQSIKALKAKPDPNK